MFRRNSSSILSEVVAEEMLLKEESQCEKKKKKKKRRKKKKKKKSRSDSSEEIIENEGVMNSDHVKRSSITKLFRKNSSKSGFMGFGDTEEIVAAKSKSSPTKKGYFGFGKSTNLLDFEKDTQLKQCDNKQEQEQEKDSEQESVWNQAASGFKYRVSNLRKQQGQKLVQNCLQTSSQGSIASALSPIAKDPKKLWGWPKRNNKDKTLFDNESPFAEKAGISPLFGFNRYQAMVDSQWEDNFGSLDVDPTTSSPTNLLTRLKYSAMKIKEKGDLSKIKKKRCVILDSEADNANSFEAAWDPFADVKELAKGVKEVVLEEEESEDTEDSENSSSTSDSNSSSEDS